MKNSLGWILAPSCLAAAAATATVPTDTAPYRAAVDMAKKYIAARTPDYKAALVPAGDGRMLGHLPYPKAVEAPLDQLVGIDPSLRTRKCDMLRAPADAAEALIKAANIAVDGTARLRATSCFRSIDEQVAIFCNAVRDKPTAPCRPPAARAISSAPPGYSEHATGYTLDFTTCTAGPRPSCADLSAAAFAGTKLGKWVLAHASEFGFELSFPCTDPTKSPCKTVQGVTYEPWHWRWVGKTAATPGAAVARRIFATARRCFPANPGIDATSAPADVTKCVKGQ